MTTGAAKAPAYGALITDNMAILRSYRDELKPRATAMWWRRFIGQAHVDHFEPQRQNHCRHRRWLAGSF